LTDILAVAAAFEFVLLLLILFGLVIYYALIPHLRRVTWTFQDLWFLSAIIEFWVFIAISFSIYGNGGAWGSFFAFYLFTAILLNIGVAYYGHKSGKWELVEDTRSVTD
jgi:hypothetical protein